MSSSNGSRESSSLLAEDGVAKRGVDLEIVRSLSIKTPQLSPANPVANRPRGRVMSFATMAVAPSPHLGPSLPPTTPALLAASAHMGTIEDLHIGAAALRRKATSQNLGQAVAAAFGQATGLRSPSVLRPREDPGSQESSVHGGPAGSLRGTSTVPGTFALPPPASGLNRTMSTLELNRAVASPRSVVSTLPPIPSASSGPVEAAVQTEESAVLPRGGLWDASAPVIRAPWHVPALVGGPASAQSGSGSSDSADSVASSPPANAVSAVPAEKTLNKRQRMVMALMIFGIGERRAQQACVGTSARGMERR